MLEDLGAEVMGPGGRQAVGCERERAGPGKPPGSLIITRPPPPGAVVRGASLWSSGEDCVLLTWGLGWISGQGTGSRMLQLRLGIAK